MIDSEGGPLTDSTTMASSASNTRVELVKAHSTTSTEQKVKCIVVSRSNKHMEQPELAADAGKPRSSHVQLQSRRSSGSSSKKRRVSAIGRILQRKPSNTTLIVRNPSSDLQQQDHMDPER